MGLWIHYSWKRSMEDKNIYDVYDDGFTKLLWSQPNNFEGHLCHSFVCYNDINKGDLSKQHCIFIMCLFWCSFLSSILKKLTPQKLRWHKEKPKEEWQHPAHFKDIRGCACMDWPRAQGLLFWQQHLHTRWYCGSLSTALVKMERWELWRESLFFCFKG